MKRIKNIDLLRAGAILYIMLYHCYVLSGQPWQAHTALHVFLSFGGEIGVTLFFLLSGYGIYLSLASSEERGKLPGWKAFMISMYDHNRQHIWLFFNPFYRPSCFLIATAT